MGAHSPAALVLMALLALASASCNHHFYQPSAEVFTTAAQLEPVVITESFITEPSSNNRLHVWQLSADRKPPFGTVLHFHGNSQNLSAHVLYSYWLTYYGFDVVIFDYSGYGQSTGEPSRRQSILDGQAFLRQYLGSKAPVVVLGQSLGGAVAVAALSKLGHNGKTLAGLVIDSSFSRYRAVARKIIGRYWLTWPLQYPLSLGISAEDDPAGHAPAISVPVRAFHSKDDPVVAYSEGKQLFEALGSKDKTLISLEGAAHTDAFHYGPKPHKRTLVEFLCGLTKEPAACLAWLEEVNATCTEAMISHCQIDPSEETPP